MQADAFRLQPPPGWHDRTLVIHSAPPEPSGAPAPNIVVGQDATARGEGFLGYVARQRETFQRSLPGFEAIEERTGSLHGRDAAQLLFRWVSGAGPLAQQASFIWMGEGRVITFTASAAADGFEAMRPLFNAQLAALELPGDAPSGG